MNGKRKWHAPNGPAFQFDEEWVSVSGNIHCWIIQRLRYGPSKWDMDITYQYGDGSVSTKNVWDFQVRYQHISDVNL